MNSSAAIDIAFYNRLVEVVNDAGSDLSTRFFASMCLVFYWMLQALIAFMFILRELLTHIYTHIRGLKTSAPGVNRTD